MRYVRYGVALGAVAMALAATPALAQTAETDAAATAQEEDTSGIGDIVVTAQKRSENVQKVPIAISAVTGQFLESREITSIDRLGSIAPNLKIDRAPNNRTAAQLAIRGSVTINPSITWEPAVGLYMDGVYIAKVQGSIFDVADLERVEVLRGPQGTLYGRNALAGAINLITKKPSGELGGNFEVSYGNYDYWRAKGSVDLPAFGPVSIKLSGQIQKRDGFVKLVDNPYPQAALAGRSPYDDTATLNGKTAMAQVRIEPTDTLTLDYTFDWSNYKQRPDFPQLVQMADIFGPAVPAHLYVTPRERVKTGSLNANPIYEKSRAHGHSLTAALDIGDATLKSITALRKLKWNDRLDLDGTPLDLAYTGRDTDFKAFSQELQLTGTAVDERLNYVLGAFYYDEKAETKGPQRFFGLFEPFGAASILQSDQGTKTEAWAAYAQADFKITDALKLTAGLRYTHEVKDAMRYFQIKSDAAIPAAYLPMTVADIKYGDVPKAKYNNLSPAATLSYEFTPDISAYARFAKGFKSGGFNGETNKFVAPTADCPSGVAEYCDPYRPEKVDSYEIGLKTRLLDRALTFNLAAFYDKHKDIQLSIFEAGLGAASVVRNAASATIKGLELEFVARPADFFTVNGSFALLDAKYDSYIDAGVDVSNNRAFPHTPKYTAALGFDWRVIEGDWGRFNLNGDLNFVSKYFTFPYALVPVAVTDNDARNTQSPGRTIVNMSGQFADIDIGGAKTSLSLWVRNLTNEKAPANFIDFGAGFGGLTVAFFPDPRTYGATLGFRF